MFTGFFSRHHRDNSEHIMDRYIPQSLSSHAFHSLTGALRTLSFRNTTSSDRSNSSLPYLDDSILNMNNTSSYEGERVLGSTLSSASPSRSESPGRLDPNSDTHLGAIRDALNFPQGRVLNFTPSNSTFTAVTPPRHTRTPRNSVPGTATSTLHSASSHSTSFGPTQSPTLHRDSISSAGSSGRRVSMDSLSDISTMAVRTSKKSKKRSPVRRQHPYRVLDAQDLRNDYYTNVVSWSTETNRTAVGLKNICYLWSEEDEQRITRFLIDEADTISVVSFSEGDFFLVATKSGLIALFSQELHINISTYCDESGRGFCSLAWVPGSLNKFYAGNEEGYVMYFEITEFGELKLVKRFQCNGQQVCGLAISQDGKEIAAGCNENCCTIWDTTNPRRPMLKQVFNHLAAVKAVAYCPWTKSLLATGGGQRDRTIKFWHTTSGTLLDTINAKGQVTSLMWCTKKKQIVATYGFADSDYPILAESYSYPRLEKMLEVVAGTSGNVIRALAGCLSPDNSSLMIAANDLTVRFYELWDPNDKLVVGSKESVFGSELIELQEGITKSGGFIR